jgi:hypothetical protein
MVDVVDAVGNLCLGFDRRGSQSVVQGVPEWQFAETAAYFCFRKYFSRQFSGAFVTGQLEYLSADTARQGDPSIQWVIDAMRIHFRNWWSRRNYSAPGGFRKPDGFGIAPNASEIQIIEVKPWDRLQEGIGQLQEMITITKNAIADYYKEQSTSMSPLVNPDFVTVKPSPWRPSGIELVCPLPYAAGAGEIAWICFKPNLRSPSSPGVILYEIHSIDKRRYQNPATALPAEMVERLRDAHKERRSAGLSLVPWANDYASANPADAERMRELALLFGIVAAVAIIAVAICVVPEILPVAAEAAEATAPVRIFVGGTYRIAPTVIEVAEEEYASGQSAEALLRMVVK